MVTILLEGLIFYFHEYGRKGNNFANPKSWQHLTKSDVHAYNMNILTQQPSNSKKQDKNGSTHN